MQCTQLTRHAHADAKILSIACTIPVPRQVMKLMCSTPFSASLDLRCCAVMAFSLLIPLMLCLSMSWNGCGGSRVKHLSDIKSWLSHMRIGCPRQVVSSILIEQLGMRRSTVISVLQEGSTSAVILSLPIWLAASGDHLCAATLLRQPSREPHCIIGPSAFITHVA